MVEELASWGPPGAVIPGLTLERHIFDRQQRVPGASGELTRLLQQIQLAAKIIASRVHRAGLAGMLGLTGEVNVQGEQVQKLDAFADTVIRRTLEGSGQLCVMASEEVEGPIPIPEPYPTGKYVLVYDPLDGSGNIDINATIGTIFGIYRRRSEHGEGSLEDLLQPGRDLVASGYVIYGSSVMLVYTTGDRVHGFTYDPSVGEFFLSHEDVRIPARGAVYSVNEGNRGRWSGEVRRWAESLKGDRTPLGRPYSLRYIGAMVADFHRTLLRGGVFAYPADSKSPHGKLRLLYEAAPLAFVVEAAGGAATDGTRRILDLTPDRLHQRTPLWIGSVHDVAFAVEQMHGSDAVEGALGARAAAVLTSGR